ncbi:MAG TPA: hypothetical protein VK582_15550 [Pyrinomonadaceae bacterium]|nr:hypothetical protein [Pyrinomonadaceae bacterium]
MSRGLTQIRQKLIVIHKKAQKAQTEGFGVKPSGIAPPSTQDVRSNTWRVPTNTQRVRPNTWRVPTNTRRVKSDV